MHLISDIQVNLLVAAGFGFGFGCFSFQARMASIIPCLVREFAVIPTRRELA